MRSARAVAATFVFVALLGCAREGASPAENAAPGTVAAAAVADPPATTPDAAPPAAGIATADGEQSGISLVVQELKRTSGGTVSLKFSVRNASGEALAYGYNYGEKDRRSDYGSMGGVTLIDEANKKKYFVVRDSEGQCVCSRGLKDQKPGETRNLWARFPAPPDDVATVSVVVPHFSPMDDVPLSR